MTIINDHDICTDRTKVTFLCAFIILSQINITFLPLVWWAVGGSENSEMFGYLRIMIRIFLEYTKFDTCLE